MEPFVLTDGAIQDIDAIWLFLRERQGIEAADQTVVELFKLFDKPSRNPNTGHRRPDLTRTRVLFQKLYSYLVVYKPTTQPLQILGVLHGKRNVLRILRKRLGSIPQ